jgi:hypothetical protein
MKQLLSLAVLSLALCALGCQNDDQKRHDVDSTTAARYSGSNSTSVTGSSDTASANRNIYGTQGHSGTLSSSSNTDPNTRTMGGGN